MRTVTLLAVMIAATAATAAAVDPPAIVGGIGVLSPHVADVSSLEAWRASTLRDGMTDRARAEAIFATVVAFIHHDSPAREWLNAPESCVHDPIKAFNVYGYSYCCCTSAYVEALARSAGLRARGWSTPGHSVAEIGDASGWHMLDPAFIDFFPRADGSLLGVEELIAGVAPSARAHPELPDDAARSAFMRGGAWRKGPEALARCPQMDDNGWLPDNGHGWYTVLNQYADPAKVTGYDYGYTTGYRLNLQLRAGERVELPWANRGLYVDDAPARRAPRWGRCRGRAAWCTRKRSATAPADASATETASTTCSPTITWRIRRSRSRTCAATAAACARSIRSGRRGWWCACRRRTSS